MAYDEALAEKIRMILAARPGFSEKKMFGGLCFLLAGNMCCGILGNRLIVRADPKEIPTLLKQKHTAPMDFTGRPLQGMIYVLPAGLKSFAALAQWVEQSAAFAQALPRKMKNRRQ